MMLFVACCLACGDETSESPGPKVPTTPTMVVRPGVPVTGVTELMRGTVSLHAAMRDDLCIDANRRGQIHLFKCHGHPNQRWTFADQPDGSVQIVGLGGSCVGGTTPANELELSPCASPASRYRLDGGRLMQVVSGACLTASDFENGGRIFLDTCSTANAGQVWTVAPVTAPAVEDSGASARVREETAWNKARVTGCELPVSLTGCDAVRIYLAKYPAGAHVEEANKALAAGQPQLEKLQKDENAWQQSGTAACRAQGGKDACLGVELYLTKYQAGLHADEARALLAPSPNAGAPTAAPGAADATGNRGHVKP
jgi:hypothetical protein